MRLIIKMNFITELFQRLKTNLNKKQPRECCGDGCQWIRVIRMIQPLHIIQLSHQHIQLIKRSVIKQ